MATNFPNSLDNFTNPASGDSQNSPSHSLQHADINDAVEAIETKLGIGVSSAGSATAGQVLTVGTGGTTTWTTVGTAGINSTGASAGDILTANASGSPSWTTPIATNNAWTAWTPTITSGAGTLTSSTVELARYIQIGKTVHLRISVLITNNGTGSSSIVFTLPVTANSSGSFVGVGREDALTGNQLHSKQVTTTTAAIFTYNNGYPGATNARIIFSATYEAA